MRVLTQVELQNTRRKLARLEALYQETERETGGADELREVELESLMRLINQLKEEISRSEVHRVARR